DAQGLAYDSGNRLRQLGDARFERDANGQITRQTSASRDDRYEWDALGQLRAAYHRDGAVTRFGYDAFGRRVFKEHTPAPPREAKPDPLANSEWAKLPLPGEPRASSTPRPAISPAAERRTTGRETTCSPKPAMAPSRNTPCGASWRRPSGRTVSFATSSTPSRACRRSSSMSEDSSSGRGLSMIGASSSVSRARRRAGYGLKRPLI